MEELLGLDFDSTDEKQNSESPFDKLVAASTDTSPLQGGDQGNEHAIQLLPGEEELEVPEPIVHNVMASCNLGVRCDLRKVALSARFAEYNPRKSNSVIIRIREPKMTGVLFCKGKLIVTGAASEEVAEIGAKKIARIVQKAGHPQAIFTDFQIDNIVAWADCGFPIRLEGLATDNPEFSSYEPEIFSGLVYRFNPQGSDKAVMSVYVTGKVMINQCRSTKQVQNAFRSVFPLFYKYQK